MGRGEKVGGKVKGKEQRMAVGVHNIVRKELWAHKANCFMMALKGSSSAGGAFISNSWYT